MFTLVHPWGWITPAGAGLYCINPLYLCLGPLVGCQLSSPHGDGQTHGELSDGFPGRKLSVNQQLRSGRDLRAQGNPAHQELSTSPVGKPPRLDFLGGSK